MKNITVNGKPVEQYLSNEKSKEVQDFYLFELRCGWKGNTSGKYIRSTNLGRVSETSKQGVR